MTPINQAVADHAGSRFAHRPPPLRHQIIHAFIFGAYSCALLGGYISDSFLGTTCFTHARPCGLPFRSVGQLGSHALLCVVCVTPGKFKTILYLSFVYVAGSIVLSVTSIPGATGDPPHWWGAAVGLTLGRCSLAASHSSERAARVEC